MSVPRFTSNLTWGAAGKGPEEGARKGKKRNAALSLTTAVREAVERAASRFLYFLHGFTFEATNDRGVIPALALHVLGQNAFTLWQPLLQPKRGGAGLRSGNLPGSGNRCQPRP